MPNPYVRSVGPKVFAKNVSEWNIDVALSAASQMTFIWAVLELVVGAE